MPGSLHLRLPLVALALVLGVLLPWAPLARAEEVAAATPSDTVQEEEEDETKKMLKQLTITLAEDAVDERTIAIRNAAEAGSPRRLLRLGNTATPEGADAEKLEATKAYLSKLVAKQMIHYKVAADEYQPASGEHLVGDVWLVGGRHINSLLTKEGYLVHATEYQEELARDILSAEAEETKKKAYKELEEALKESEAAKAQERRERAAAQKAAEKAEQEKGEPIGLGGYGGLMVAALIIIGAATNFGREDKKKRVNLNKKRSFMGKIWLKLKGTHAA